MSDDAFNCRICFDEGCSWCTNIDELATRRVLRRASEHQTGHDIPGDGVTRTETPTTATPRGSEGVVRDEVEVMSHAMEYKLRQNDHKGGWELKSNELLFQLLKDEVVELEEAIQSGNFIDIMLEAADVANYAMMIAWNSMKGKLK